MKKTYLLISLSYLMSLFALAQIPTGYYDNAEGLEGIALRAALHDIIDDHTSISYGNIFGILDQTDLKPNGKIWDMYSDVPGETPPYEYTFIEDQCGNYSGEGSCYNREHSWPKSWFGDKFPPCIQIFIRSSPPMDIPMEEDQIILMERLEMPHGLP